MSSVNLFTREISIKVVYYGPGLGGKTSSLQLVHQWLRPEARGQMVSLATGVDRTLYFDFLPLKLPRLRGYSIRVQLYTVPGQVHYDSTRKLVLAGADGVVFVADSQRDRDSANVESFENLRDNLAEQGMRLDTLPHIFQFNKRDAPQVLPVAQMQKRLNLHGVPAFETVATSGAGVFDALKCITTLVLNDLRKRGIWDGGAGPRASTAEFVKDNASIAQRVAALSEAVDAVAQLEAPGPTPPPRGPIGRVTNRSAAAVPPTGTPTPAAARRARVTPPFGSVPLSPPSRDGVPSRAPAPPRSGASLGLAELLAQGPVRDQVAAAEAHLVRGDNAEAVRTAARAFAESSRAESTSMEIAPVLRALMLGMGGRRYLRFCEAAMRADQGSCTPADAQFAIFFLVDSALER